MNAPQTLTKINMALHKQLNKYLIKLPSKALTNRHKFLGKNFLRQ